MGGSLGNNHLILCPSLPLMDYNMTASLEKDWGSAQLAAHHSYQSSQSTQPHESTRVALAQI